MEHRPSVVDVSWMSATTEAVPNESERKRNATYASMAAQEKRIAHMPFSRRSFPTWGPTFSAESSVKGPASVFDLSQSATAGDTPGVFAASSADAKRPLSERAEMIA